MTDLKYFCKHNEVRGNISQLEIKRANLARVFSLIEKKHGLSRTSIAKEVHLTKATVSSLVDELCEKGLVMQIGMGESVTGRKPILLEINPDGAMFPVLVLRPTGIRYMLYNLCFEQLETVFRPFPAGFREDGDSASDKIASIALELLHKDAQKINWDKVPTVCLCYPGSFRWDRNLFSSAVLQTRTKAEFVQKIYANIKGKPLFLENESTCVAYAEMCARYGQNEDMVFINISDGIGHERIEKGRMRCKDDETPLEFGHITINMNGRKCLCGNRGCVERYVSCSAIVKDVVDKIREGEKSMVTDLVGGDLDAVSIDTLRLASEANDQLVNSVLREASRCLAYAINTLTCVQNTGEIVLGGGIERVGERFLNFVRESIACIGCRNKMDRVQVSYTVLKENADSEGIVRQYVDSYMP